jgi:hypothetical protein
VSEAKQWLARFSDPVDLSRIEFLPLIDLLKDAKAIIDRQQKKLTEQQPVVDAAIERQKVIDNKQSFQQEDDKLQQTVKKLLGGQNGQGIAR